MKAAVGGEYIGETALPGHLESQDIRTHSTRQCQEDAREVRYAP